MPKAKKSGAGADDNADEADVAVTGSGGAAVVPAVEVEEEVTPVTPVTPSEECVIPTDHLHEMQRRQTEFAVQLRLEQFLTRNPEIADYVNGLKLEIDRLNALLAAKK